MKSTPDKCHLLVSVNDNIAIRIENFQIENTKRKQSFKVYSLTKSCLSVIIYQKYSKKASRKRML